jgi:hypothetical protein
MSKLIEYNRPPTHERKVIPVASFADPMFVALPMAEYTNFPWPAGSEGIPRHMAALMFADDIAEHAAKSVIVIADTLLNWGRLTRDDAIACNSDNQLKAENLPGLSLRKKMDEEVGQSFFYLSTDIQFDLEDSLLSASENKQGELKIILKSYHNRTLPIEKALNADGTVGSNLFTELERTIVDNFVLLFGEMVVAAFTVKRNDSHAEKFSELLAFLNKLLKEAEALPKWVHRDMYRDENHIIRFKG